MERKESKLRSRHVKREKAASVDAENMAWKNHQEKDAESFGQSTDCKRALAQQGKRWSFVLRLQLSSRKLSLMFFL